jgi:hypothetical protein
VAEASAQEASSPGENFEFLDSLEHYFTPFRTRFEEKAFLSHLMYVVRSKKYFCRTLYCTHKYNSKISTMPSVFEVEIIL